MFSAIKRSLSGEKSNIENKKNKLLHEDNVSTGDESEIEEDVAITVSEDAPEWSKRLCSQLSDLFSVLKIGIKSIDEKLDDQLKSNEEIGREMQAVTK